MSEGASEARGVRRRARARSVDRAIGVLFADGDPRRLDAMIEVAGEARLLTYGARSAATALTIIERHDVDAVVVAEDFEPARAREVMNAARGRRWITVNVERPAGVRSGSAALAWPFTPDALRAAVIGP